MLCEAQARRSFGPMYGRVYQSLCLSSSNFPYSTLVTSIISESLHDGEDVSILTFRFSH